MSAAPRFWLFKTEPQTFSIQDLQARPKQTAPWDGVRNYQSRNMLRDLVQLGDRVLIHHSSTKSPAIAGVAIVVQAGYPDPTALDPTSPYFDARSSRESPRWYAVDVQLEQIFPRPLSLSELRTLPELKAMMLLKRGARLSIQPVTADEFQAILARAGQ